jgi:biotin-(acetyl-CoA carboxylase) ligase
MNLARLLEQRAKESPTRPALIYGEKEISFRGLSGSVNRLASAFKDLGIDKGDRVAIMLPNTPEFVYVFFACQKIGAVAVPFNTMYKGGEILHILRDSGAKAIVTLTNFAPLIQELRSELPQLQYVITTGERTVVFADPESTLFAQLVLSRSSIQNLDEAYRKVGQVLVEVFQSLGLAGVWYKHKGSLRIGGRKLAGFLFSELEDLYLVNIISFLKKFNPADFFKAIWVPPEIKDKILEPLTSVEEEIGKSPDPEVFKECLVKSFERHFKVQIREAELTREERFGYEKQIALLTKPRKHLPGLIREVFERLKKRVSSLFKSKK